MNHRTAARVAPGTVTIAAPGASNFVRDLQKRFSNQLGFLPGAALDEYIANGRVLIVRDNGDPAGYLLGPRRLASLPFVRPLVQTAVCYDAQRRALGLQLVETAAAAARRDGQTVLQAWCREDIEAGAFWTAAGFVPLFRRRTSTARGHDMILWRRPLVEHVGVDFLRLPARAGWTAARVTNGEFLSPRLYGPTLTVATAAAHPAAGESRKCSPATPPPVPRKRGSGNLVCANKAGICRATTTTRCTTDVQDGGW